MKYATWFATLASIQSGCSGCGDGVGVGLPDGEGLTDGWGVGVRAGVAVGSGVGVALGVGAGVGVGVGDTEGVGSGSLSCTTYVVRLPVVSAVYSTPLA